jgi:hypothetical protein
MKRIFLILLVSLFWNCFEFQEMTFSFDLKHKTMQIDLSRPFCSVCMDTNTHMTISDSEKAEYAKIPESDRTFYTILLLCHAHFQVGDSFFFRDIIKSSIGNVKYNLTSKKVYKSSGSVHCRIDAAIETGLPEEDCIKYVLTDVFKEGFFVQRGEVAVFKDTDYVYTTNADYELNTRKNHLYIWNTLDSCIVIKMVKLSPPNGSRLFFDSYYDSSGNLSVRKIPAVFLKHYDPSKMLKELYK